MSENIENQIENLTDELSSDDVVTDIPLRGPVMPNQEIREELADGTLTFEYARWTDNSRTMVQAAYFDSEGWGRIENFPAQPIPGSLFIKLIDVYSIEDIDEMSNYFWDNEREFTKTVEELRAWQKDGKFYEYQDWKTTGEMQQFLDFKESGQLEEFREWKEKGEQYSELASKVDKFGLSDVTLEELEEFRLWKVHGGVLPDLDTVIIEESDDEEDYENFFSNLNELQDFEEDIEMPEELAEVVFGEEKVEEEEVVEPRVVEKIVEKIEEIPVEVPTISIEHMTQHYSTEDLFRMKIEVFDIPAVRNAPQELKTRIRKSKTPVELFAIIHEANVISDNG
jgi:hypothetical protein